MRLCIELCLQIGLVAAAHASAIGAAALSHKAVDNAVKHDAIVKAFANQFCDPRDMAGGQIRAHSDDNITGFEC